MRSPTSSEHACPTSGLRCADAFLWLSSRAFCGPAGAWENVEPRAGTAPPPCVVEASHRPHIVIVHIPARHRRASPHRVRPRLCHVLSRHESIMSPLIFRIRIRHTPDRMSNNKLLNLSLRIERRRVPLHTQHTCMHMQCRPSPPKQLRHSWLSRSQVSTAQQAQSAAINVFQNK